MSDVTEYQLAILVHATGWDTISPLHRNSFMPAANQMSDIQSLVAKGLMILLHAPVPDVQIDNGTFQVTVAGIAYIARSQQWTNTALKLNRALSSECMRLRRENERYRRKLAKRRAAVMRKQWKPEFGFGEFKNWYNRWTQLRWHVERERRYLQYASTLERERNPGLRRFLAWQDAFTLEVESPALEPGVVLALAPSQKIDFTGIEDLATKAGAQ